MISADDPMREVGPLFRPVNTRRTFEEAVSQIAETIAEGRLHVGDSLPSERVLAQQMEISRATIREAIAVLTRAGVLDVQQGSGRRHLVTTSVIPWNEIHEGADVRASEVEALLEMRRLLEPRVAQLAALRGTAEDFAAMAKTIERQRENPDDPALFAQQNWQFHRRLVQAARNPIADETLRRVYRGLDAAMDMIRGREDPAWSIEIHQRTLAAIKRGDHDEIDRAMDEHLGFLEQIWEQESGRSRIRTTPPFLLGSQSPAR